LKKLLIVSLVLILAIALVIPMAGVSLASSGTAVTIPDLVWQKTVNSSVDATLGSTSHGYNDSYWTWTSNVWDGPNINPNATLIDGYAGHENDFWAYWQYEGSYTHKWFKTTVNIDKAHLVGVRLVSKWRGLNLTINDNLYVYVNGTKVAWGGHPINPRARIITCYTEKLMAGIYPMVFIYQVQV
jgi:hypothetical protein